MKNSLRERLGQAQQSGRTNLRQWNDRMLAQADEPQRMGTRWRRSTFAFAPATAAVVSIAYLMVQGVLAASFNVANQPFDLHVAQLDGQGLGAVLAAESVKNSHGSTSHQGALHAGLAAANIQGLCIVIKQPLFGIPYSITLSAGHGDTVSGRNLYFDIGNLNATPAVLKGAILGESADAVNVNGNSLGGAAGGFGLDNSRGTATMSNVDASAYQAQVAGSLTLPHLSIGVHLGTVTGC
jgi:hypothetical protein